MQMFFPCSFVIWSAVIPASAGMNPANVWFGYSRPKLIGSTERTGRDRDDAAGYLDVSSDVSNCLGVFDHRLLINP
jgi:hypothetical protein